VLRTLALRAIAAAGAASSNPLFYVVGSTCRLPLGGLIVGEFFSNKCARRDYSVLRTSPFGSPFGRSPPLARRRRTPCFMSWVRPVDCLWEV
jgi:hypothetical protein